jgi:hypothetical protein
MCVRDHKGQAAIDAANWDVAGSATGGKWSAPQPAIYEGNPSAIEDSEAFAWYCIDFIGTRPCFGGAVAGPSSASDEGACCNQRLAEDDDA